MPPTIIHLDIDAFFASVEQRDDPKLRGRPVAVGTGVVASCSYESRRYGVRTGMRLAEARQLCKDLIVVPGAYPRYEQAARHVLAICAEKTPIIEVAALDDLYLDLGERKGERGVRGEERGVRSEERGVRNQESGISESKDFSSLLTPHSSLLTPRSSLLHLGKDLRSAVQDEVKLSVSLGSGTNKMVARVATNSAKPGGHVHVPAGTEMAYLAPCQVRVLPGVGHVIESRFERLNVHKVHEVAGMPVEVLRQLFGPNKGRTLHDQAHGLDPRPVEVVKVQQSVGRRASFDPPVAERPFLAAMLNYLLDRACSWLRFHHLATRGLALTIRYGDYESAQGRESFRAASADETLLRAAALDRFDRLYQRRLPLRFLGVELAPLTTPLQEPTLFTDAADEKKRSLLAVKDEIRQRFGFTSLLSGQALELSEKMQRDRENYQMRTPSLSR